MKKRWLGAVMALLWLCGCGQADVAPPEEPALPEPAPLPAAYDVPGEEASAAPAVTDGLEGAYYNDFLRALLTLDGMGGCTLRLEGDETEAGTYTRAADTLTLALPEGEETVTVDADGDLTVEGRTGYFFRDWAFWGITEEEAGSEPQNPYTEGLEETGDGVYRCRDLASGVACTIPAGFELVPGALEEAVTVTDGSGYVSGRNVTADYLAEAGTPDDFAGTYLETRGFEDFRRLYGSLVSYSGLTLDHSGTGGVLAEARMEMICRKGVVTVRATLYTSTYPDGTVNYICKTVFSPGRRQADLEERAAAIADLGAVRQA